MAKKFFIAGALMAFSFLASPSFAQSDGYSRENDDVYANGDDYNRNRDRRIEERQNQRWAEANDRQAYSNDSYYANDREYVCRRGYHVNCRHDRFMQRHHYGRYRANQCPPPPQTYSEVVWVPGHWQYGRRGHRHWVPGHHSRQYY